MKLFSHTVKVTSENYPAHNHLGLAFLAENNFDQAMKHFARAVQIKPQNFQAYNNMGVVFALEGKVKEAVSCWNRVLKLKSDWVPAINNLAWTKATQDDPNLRNPEEAVQLATRACELTEYSQADCLDTLAAAYAASGRYSQAIETAQKAVPAAEGIGDKKLAKEIRERLNLYRAGRPYIVKNNPKH
jgi:tetratricopeptide (TPR) repeat protein